METTAPPVSEKEQKELYTYADYAALPEGAPYELIRGELLMAPAPNTTHQRILRVLFRHLDNVTQAAGQGEVLFAPTDVRLSDLDTVQPDLLYISEERRHIIGEAVIEGAPDLVVEVLSASTAHRDLTTKKRLYEQHGVQEYWIVDPEQRTVEVHGLDDGLLRQQVRVVDEGTVASTLLAGFTVDLAVLFEDAPPSEAPDA
jgi:Uma2 family endonuclease